MNVISFVDWFNIHEEKLQNIFAKVNKAIQYNTHIYYPITSMIVNEDVLFEKLIDYIYKTSNNTSKKYII